jgi:uncharacterized membrane protein YidH (DUF202 family)|tara:strand:- start:61 stop:666 length:606 start_codon:yes stop_codon:yes gene_type:complete
MRILKSLGVLVVLFGIGFGIFALIGEAGVLPDWTTKSAFEAFIIRTSFLFILFGIPIIVAVFCYLKVFRGTVDSPANVGPILVSTVIVVGVIVAVLVNIFSNVNSETDYDKLMKLQNEKRILYGSGCSSYEAKKDADKFARKRIGINGQVYSLILDKKTDCTYYFSGSFYADRDGPNATPRLVWLTVRWDGYWQVLNTKIM